MFFRVLLDSFSLFRLGVVRAPILYIVLLTLIYISYKVERLLISHIRALLKASPLIVA